MIAGDFNAEIGVRQAMDNQLLIGSWSTGEQNYRGFMLKRWCELNDMLIANTMYPKTRKNIVTYVGPNKHERQIDYVLIGRKTRKLLRNSGSTGEVDLGSDHRGVEVILKLVQRRKKHGQRKQPKTAAWKSVNEDVFREKTDEIVQNAKISRDLQTRCEEIEEILLEAAVSSVETQIQDMDNADDEFLRGLLERRHALSIGTVKN